MSEYEKKLEGNIGEVSHDLLQTKKTLGALKSKRTVNCINFNPSQANPGETLLVRVPKLGANEVIVPGSLALRFDIDLSGGHAMPCLQDTKHYDIYSTFSDLFLPAGKRDNTVPEGIQSEDLCKIRSNSGDKKTSGVDAEKR